MPTRKMEELLYRTAGLAGRGVMVCESAGMEITMAGEVDDDTVLPEEGSKTAERGVT